MSETKMTDFSSASDEQRRRAVDEAVPMPNPIAEERAKRRAKAESKALTHHLPAVLRRLEHGIPRVPSGWAMLDRALRDGPEDRGGFVKPSVNVLGAKPKLGKSTWAQIVAENH